LARNAAQENTTPEQRRHSRLKKFPIQDQSRIMVETLLVPQGGLNNPNVIDAMKRVPRNRFVPPMYQSLAFWDQAIAIGNSQTISPPYIVAFMTEQLDPKPADKVLEIGTGSGYQAAVMSLLVDQVYSIEIVEPLAIQAKALLEKLGMDNVHLKVGDGYKGWADAAPFDSIIVTCSPESIPQPLADQLREGGRMIIPLGERFQQAFYLCRKVNGKLEKERLTQTLFVPMTGEAEKQRSVLPDPKKPKIFGGDFSEVREDGSPTGWHYARDVQILTPENQVNGQKIARFTIKQVKKSTGKNPPDRPLFSQILQGFAVDGREVQGLRVEYRMRGQNILARWGHLMTPTAIICLFDEERRLIDEILLGTCMGNFGWDLVSRDIPIKPETREATILIGLPAATGQLDVQNVSVKASP
jgi:protein-L-isoaspartate(D-aspartate) O-methyltransferase